MKNHFSMFQGRFFLCPTFRWLKDNDHIDGVLGFSQGACFAAILAAKINLKFAIIAGGFAPRSPELAILFNYQVRVPSLHFMGETDELVPCNLNKKLAAAFVSPEIYLHGGG